VIVALGDSGLAALIHIDAVTIMRRALELISPSAYFVLF
jgi:hypothetical protein